jgi:CRISPR-associated exonuclease Cas4
MFVEDDLLPLSALQHLAFCERQCALIHIEQQWSENLFTAQGRVLHEKVHSETAERRRDVRVEYGMSLRSLRLGLIGKADVIEFHRMPDDGIWQPFPVEYKRGRKKLDNRDNVQLCAQALCLEEMLKVVIPGGAIYYGKERRRTDVAFDGALREETAETARRLRRLIESGKTPPPVYEEKCDTCSLLGICLPRTLEKGKSVTRYFAEMTKE